MVGVGVRVFPRCEEGTTWVEGGGVIWLALSTRLDCSFDMASVELAGSCACGGSGVTGSETCGIGSKPSRLSCDSCGSMATTVVQLCVLARRGFATESENVFVVKSKRRSQCPVVVVAQAPRKEFGDGVRAD